MAGDGIVSMAAGTLTGQAVAEGLVDEISVSLVPVVFGSGVRFFGAFAGDMAADSALVLDDPELIAGDRVVHLHSGSADLDYGDLSRDEESPCAFPSAAATSCSAPRLSIPTGSASSTSRTNRLTPSAR